MKYRIKQTEYDAWQLGVDPKQDDEILKRCQGTTTHSHIEGKRYYISKEIARPGDWVLAHRGGFAVLSDKVFQEQYEKIVEPTTIGPHPPSSNTMHMSPGLEVITKATPKEKA